MVGTSPFRPVCFRLVPSEYTPGCVGTCQASEQHPWLVLGELPASNIVKSPAQTVYDEQISVRHRGSWLSVTFKHMQEKNLKHTRRHTHAQRNANAERRTLASIHSKALHIFWDMHTHRLVYTLILSLSHMTKKNMHKLIVHKYTCTAHTMHANAQQWFGQLSAWRSKSCHQRQTLCPLSPTSKLKRFTQSSRHGRTGPGILCLFF